MITRSGKIFTALLLEIMIMEKAVQRLKDPPQARPLGEEVFHARSPKPHSSPLYVFSRGMTIQLLYSTPDFDLRKLNNFLNTGETWGQKVSLLRSFEPKLSLPLAQLCMEYEYLVKAIFGFAWAVAVVKGR
jgi:hypothetical protein